MHAACIFGVMLAMLEMPGMPTADYSFAYVKLF